MGFKQVFDNLTVKHMDALRKQIQSLVDYVLNQFLDICNVKQILTNRKDYITLEVYLVCSAINERYDIR